MEMIEISHPRNSFFLIMRSSPQFNIDAKKAPELLSAQHIDHAVIASTNSETVNISISFYKVQRNLGLLQGRAGPFTGRAISRKSARSGRAGPLLFLGPLRSN